MQLGRIFFLVLLTLVALQSVCHHRQSVFDRLLAAYGILRKKVADLERAKEAQDTRIAELEGLFLPSLPTQHLLSLNFSLSNLPVFL